jgi:CheY-like chemotaxis protein
MLRSPGVPMANELILIVEDDHNSRKLVRDLLDFHGYKTLEAATGEEGVRLSVQFRPALILMDIELPGINGIEALERLRQDPATRAIPIIAVTASVMPHDRQKVIGAGFDGYHRKPIAMKDFLKDVRQVLDRRPEAGPAT